MFGGIPENKSGIFFNIAICVFVLFTKNAYI